VLRTLVPARSTEARVSDRYARTRAQQ